MIFVFNPEFKMNEYSVDNYITNEKSSNSNRMLEEQHADSCLGWCRKSEQFKKQGVFVCHRHMCPELSYLVTPCQ